MLNHLKIFEQPDILKVEIPQRLIDQLTQSSTKELNPNTCQSRTDKGKTGPKWDYERTTSSKTNWTNVGRVLLLERVVVNLFFVSFSPSVFFKCLFLSLLFVPVEVSVQRAPKIEFPQHMFPISNKMFDIIFISLEVFVFMIVNFCNIFQLFFILYSFATFVIYNDFFMCFFVIDRIYQNI